MEIIKHIARNGKETLKHQVIYKATAWIEGKDEYSMRVNLRFDDKCKNGQEDFAITADIKKNNYECMGGCCHDEISKNMPELAKYIKWHLCGVDGPRYYLENTTYHAGNRDFDVARSCAIWPDATDAQLSLDKPELTKLLTARLPKLLKEFKSDMLELGFVYPESEAIAC
jgi:hypothetical protein